MDTSPTEPPDDGADRPDPEEIDRASSDEVYQPTADPDTES